jgi:hypothetical protein
LHTLMNIEEEETGLKWRSNGREIEKVIIRGKLDIRTKPGGRENSQVEGEQASKSVKEMSGRRPPASPTLKPSQEKASL